MQEVINLTIWKCFQHLDGLKKQIHDAVASEVKSFGRQAVLEARLTERRLALPFVSPQHRKAYEAGTRKLEQELRELNNWLDQAVAA